MQSFKVLLSSPIVMEDVKLKRQMVRVQPIIMEFAGVIKVKNLLPTYLEDTYCILFYLQLLFLQTSSGTMTGIEQKQCEFIP